MPNNPMVERGKSSNGGRALELPAVPRPGELSKAERLALLSRRPLLQNLDVSVLEEIDAAVESVHFAGGARVLARGESAVPLFLVVRGALRASFVDRKGRPEGVWEYFRGSSLGESYVLSGRPSPFDLHALRDTHLLRLSPEKFDALVARHPVLAQRFARAVAARIVDLLDSPETLGTFASRTDRLPRSVALLTVGGDAVRRTRDALARALDAARSTTCLDGRDARAAMSAGIEHHLEDPSKLLILQCDRSEPLWLDFCLRQTDRIMVLVEADACPPIGKELEWWRATKLEGRPGHVELAIVHQSSTEVPRDASGFVRLPGLARLHHVRDRDPRDAQRLARWLMDRPIGLVLGGGGAYGIAHVGVFKALEEARVPIDAVGGTSMGAIVAGAVALGWSADHLMAEVRKLFSSPFVLYDPTIPFTAILAGKKLDRILEKFFDGIAIGDLWRPYFSIATDLSHARPRVCDQGSLRDAIRASCSIPGVFPPFRQGDEVLVDGGLVDNVPIDVMGARCHGPIISVDVFPYDRREARPSAGLREVLRSVAGASTPLFDTLVRSTLIGSRHTTETALANRPPALHLVPELLKFNVLEWRAHEALFEAGYACARRAIEAGEFPRTLWEGRIRDTVS